MKRLTKSNKDRYICGVCAGIAEYFDVDPTMIRLGLIAFCLLGGSGIFAYIVAAILMPEADDTI